MNKDLSTEISNKNTDVHHMVRCTDWITNRFGLFLNCNDTFHIYITISTFTSFLPYSIVFRLASCPILSHFMISEVRSQNVTNKSCLVCAKGKKYAFCVTLRFTGSTRQGNAELRTYIILLCRRGKVEFHISKLTSVYIAFPVSFPSSCVR